MSNWFHAAKGRYFIKDKWIGLDYSKLFLDPIDAEITLYHETSHSIMAVETDFGQATQVIYKLQDALNHLDAPTKELLCQTLYLAQDFVQEGLATFMQIAHLGNLTNKDRALKWAKENLPDEYQEKLEKLKFGLDLSARYRDFFTGKISWLVMEAGFRKNASKLKLLSDVDTLKKYLEDPEVNPNKRLEKVIETLKYKGWLVTKPMPEIAEACGIQYFDPATRQEVADYLTYVASLTANPHTFTESDITETPASDEILRQAQSTIVVGNMNFNFEESAEALFNLDDFLHYADQMELLFIALDDEPQDKLYKQYIRSQTGHDPEISLGGFLKSGEKYITATSKQKTGELLNKELKTPTLLVKWGGFSLETNSFAWSSTTRVPDLIVYNTVADLEKTLSVYLDKYPKEKFEYLHLGASENHPLQTLFIKIDGKSSIHVANAFGNRSIAGFIQKYKDKSGKITDDELKVYKIHINNLMACWMGMKWEIDWVETMLDGNILHYR